MTSKEVAEVLGITVLLAILTFLCWTSGVAWRAGDGVVMIGGGWIAGGAACLLASASVIFAVRNGYHFFVRNVIGRPAVYATVLVEPLRFHAHADDREFDERKYYPVIVRGRVGGWFRGSEIVNGGLDGRTVCAWDGETITVADQDGSITMPVGTVMMFLGCRSNMAWICVSHEGLSSMASELVVLHRVAEARQSPFGQSLHGQFVRERTGHVMKRFPKLVQMYFRDSVWIRETVKEILERPARSAS